MKVKETYQWLMENGGPVIRHRTATELMPSVKAIDIKGLQNDLLKSPLVQIWLDNFKPPTLITRKMDSHGEFTRASVEIHAAKDTALENVLGKLTDLGLKKGMPELDERVSPYLAWLKSNADLDTGHFFLVWMALEVADFLARAGYADEPVVQNLLREHLDVVYQFARKDDYNIYVDAAKYKKMPGNFTGRPLINPELTRGKFRLPLVYDITGWEALAAAGTDKDREKIDTVIGYILNERYQQFPWGYGIMLDETSGHYWAMGWSIHLPGFAQAIGGNLEKQLRIFRLAQLVNFRAARRHPWVKAGLEYLEQFRTEKGTYLFPREYLPENPAAYWAVGAKMALEANPRNKKALEIESTFWMAKFHKALKD